MVVVADIRLERPGDVLRLEAALHDCSWCLAAYRVHVGPLVVSGDGLRVLAFFRAPDAEAVRMAYRGSRLPFERVVALRPIRNSVRQEPAPD